MSATPLNHSTRLATRDIGVQTTYQIQDTRCAIPGRSARRCLPVPRPPLTVTLPDSPGRPEKPWQMPSAPASCQSTRGRVVPGCSVQSAAAQLMQDTRREGVTMPPS